MKNYFKLFMILLYLPNSAMCQLIFAQKQEYVFNNLKDTIHFSRFEWKITKIGNNPSIEFYDEVKITDSIQIDGIGRKEIIFYRFCRFTNSQHGGSFDIDENIEIGKYEIWNLDTKTNLFEAITYEKKDFKNFRAGIGFTKENKLYNSILKIDSLGKITIKIVEENLYIEKTKENKMSKKKSRNKTSKKNLKPKFEEVIYKYINGKYIKENNK